LQNSSFLVCGTAATPKPLLYSGIIFPTAVNLQRNKTKIKDIDDAI